MESQSDRRPDTNLKNLKRRNTERERRDTDNLQEKEREEKKY